MRSVLRVLPMVVIGGLAAFLLVGPLSRLATGHPAAGRPPIPSPSESSSLPSPAGSPLATPAGLPLTGPKGAGCAIPPRPTGLVRTPLAQAPTLPSRLWVNEPLGVNLRARPSTAADRLALLSPGTAVTAVERATDAGGATWYRVNGVDGGTPGWLMGAFVVATPVRLAVFNDDWQALLPDGYQAIEVAPYHTEIRTLGSDYPFLWVKTEFTTGGLQPPAAIRWDVSPIFDHTKQLQVWNYTVTASVSRYPLNTCTVPAIQGRPDSGWPFVTTLFVRTQHHGYEFRFISSEPDSPVVAQVLQSLLFA